ncbi:MAG: hypothetical protein HQM12_23205 [SAR324 cluster bacterium]|nr:hypothetical protein [SAR324 cluster bacterium]
MAHIFSHGYRIRTIPVKKLLFMALLLTGMSACAPLKHFWTEYNKSPFEKGMEALEKKRYQSALILFRQVPPDSEKYPEALQAVSQISYLKGEWYFEKKRYKSAFAQLNTILEGQPDYDKALALKNRALFEVELSLYEKASGDAKREAFENLVLLTKENREAERFRKIIKMITHEMEQTQSLLEVMSLTKLFHEATSTQSDPGLLNEALFEIIPVIQRFQASPSLMMVMMEAIAQLKYQIKQASSPKG